MQAGPRVGLSGIRWDQLLAFPFWALTLYLLRPSILRQGAWRKPEGLLARLFTANAALSLSLQIDPVAQAFDRAVGVSNLSWLLAYILGVATAYTSLEVVASSWEWSCLPRLGRRAFWWPASWPPL